MHDRPEVGHTPLLHHGNDLVSKSATFNGLPAVPELLEVFARLVAAYRLL